MDAEEAYRYFETRGVHTSLPLRVHGHRHFMSPRELYVEGDAVSGDSASFAKHEQAEAVSEKSETPPLFTPREENVLQKQAGQESQQISPLPVSVCTTCLCAQAARGKMSPNSPSAAGTVDQDSGGSNSDSDSTDEEELSVDRLLGMMARLDRRPAASAVGVTLMRLAASITPTHCVEVHHFNQLKNYMESGKPLLKEVSLKLLERLLSLDTRVDLVAHMSVIHSIISLALDHTQQPSTQVLAFGVLDKLLNVTELDYAQVWDRLEMDVYPSVMQCLHSHAPLEVKYAACCIVRTLARDSGFAARIKMENLFLLRQLREASARMKEAYVGILMAMFAHPGLTEAGSVDTGILPVIRGLLQDGPCEVQKQALDLVHCLTCDDHGVEVITKDRHLTVSIIACLLTSRCRKVRRNACLLSMTLTSPRQPSVAHTLLEAVADYVHPHEAQETTVGGGRVARVTYPVPAKNKADMRLWYNLDCFLDSVASLFHTEGLLKMERDHLYSELPLRGEVSGLQLWCLSDLVQLVTNMCCWPLQRRAPGFGDASLPGLDLTHLSDDLSLRDKFVTLNHKMAVQQWKRFGPSVFAVFRWISQRISLHLRNSSPVNRMNSTGSPQSSTPSASSRPSSSTVMHRSLARLASRLPTAYPSTVLAKELLSEQEWSLLHSLLNFLLCVALASCKSVPDPFSVTTKSPPVASRPVKKVSSSTGLWVAENPHLTQSSSQVNPQKKAEELARKLQEDLEKEAAAERRTVRRQLHNEGLFALLAPLAQLADHEVKVMCSLILRASVLPLEEKVHSSNTSFPKDAAHLPPQGHSLVTSAAKKARPQSAQPAQTRKDNRQINIALHRMSPSSATIVRDALGSQHRPDSKTGAERHPSSARRPVSVMTAASPKEHISHPESAASSGSSVSAVSTIQLESSASSWVQHPLSPMEHGAVTKPRVLAVGQPINIACQREAVEECGAAVIQSLFCRSHSVKLYTLLFLHDVVKFTNVEVHMELSKLGIVPKLLDFIRVSNDDGQLQILGLRVVELLMTDNGRLQQLFSRHGGHILLTALTRMKSASLQTQVKATLASVTKGKRFESGVGGKGRRPMSAPIGRRESCPAEVQHRPRDIWDHIMQRWSEEDKVVEVLQKFK